MKYFTPILYAAMQDFSSDAAMNSADAAWEAAGNNYNRHLSEIGPALAAVTDQFGKILLHDAVVQSMSRAGEQFTIVLQADIPPRDVVTIRYELSGEPRIEMHEMPTACRSTVLQFECDEFDVIEEGGQRCFLHSILFGNGCEVTLRFHTVQVTLARPVLPLHGAPGLTPLAAADRRAV
jgi:hypothetical protein